MHDHDHDNPIIAALLALDNALSDDLEPEIYDAEFELLDLLAADHYAADLLSDRYVQLGDHIVYITADLSMIAVVDEEPAHRVPLLLRDLRAHFGEG